MFGCKDTGFRLDALHAILQQEVLLQEDVELIELLDPSILSAGHPQQENGHLPTLCSLATPNIWYRPENISLLTAYKYTACNHQKKSTIIFSIVKVL